MYIAGGITPYSLVEKNDHVFDSVADFANVLREENIKLPSPDREVTLYYYEKEKAEKNEEYNIKEVRRVFEHDENLKIILSVFSDEQAKVVSREVRIWRIEQNNYQFKEYINGQLSFDEIYPYSDDEGTSFEAFTELEKFDPQDETIQPNLIAPPVGTQPAFCIMEGTCCMFSGKTYAYCGKYCGYKQKAGGRDNGADTINSLDACCYWHDVCLKDGLRKRCGCHDGFLDCASRTSGAPGKWTIYAGIWVQKKLEKC